MLGVGLAWLIASLYEWLVWREAETRWPPIERGSSERPRTVRRLPAGSEAAAPRFPPTAPPAPVEARALGPPSSEPAAPATSEGEPPRRDADRRFAAPRSARAGQAAAAERPAIVAPDERVEGPPVPERVSGPVAVGGRSRRSGDDEPPEPADTPRGSWIRSALAGRGRNGETPPRPEERARDEPAEPSPPEPAEPTEEPELDPVATDSPQPPAQEAVEPAGTEEAPPAAEPPRPVPKPPAAPRFPPPRAVPPPSPPRPREPAVPQPPSRSAPRREAPVVPLPPRPPEPRQWNIWELESLARQAGREAPARMQEWSFLFLYLREFAEPRGLLPTEFDGLVRESFGRLLERLEGA